MNAVCKLGPRSAGMRCGASFRKRTGIRRGPYPQIGQSWPTNDIRVGASHGLETLSLGNSVATTEP